MTTTALPLDPNNPNLAEAPDASSLRMPLVATGLAMAAYLAARPYGDAGGLDADAAAAFASNWWIAAHLFGVFALASFARLALRVADLTRGLSGQVARWSGLAGLVMVLPYYGAETFGLHAIGAAARDGDPAVVDLADQVRNQPAALVLFGLGLVLLAISGVAVAVAWQRWSLARGIGAGRAAWPLAIGIVLLLPQFYLPPVGRIGFGVAYLVAALWWTVQIGRSAARDVGRRGVS